MIYAQVSTDRIVRVAPAPTAPGFEDGEWRDFTDPEVVTAWHAAYGWLPLTEEPRPADTATHTSDPEHVLIDGTPVLRWEARPKTEAELAAEAAAVAAARRVVVSDTLTAAATADDARVLAAIDDLRVLLASSPEVGSIRTWRQQSNAQIVTASSLKALADLLLTHAQANRRVARQTLRLARLATGTLDSAEVGTE